MEEYNESELEECMERCDVALYQEVNELKCLLGCQDALAVCEVK